MLDGNETNQTVRTMKLSELSKRDLDTIRQKLDRKEKLLEEVREIDEKINAMATNSAEATQSSQLKVGKRLPRGYIKDNIISLLTSAGRALTVTEIAEELGVAKTKVFVWLSNNGGEHGIKKVARSTYTIETSKKKSK